MDMAFYISDSDLNYVSLAEAAEAVQLSIDIALSSERENMLWILTVAEAAYSSMIESIFIPDFDMEAILANDGHLRTDEAKWVYQNAKACQQEAETGQNVSQMDLVLDLHRTLGKYDRSKYEWGQLRQVDVMVGGHVAPKYTEVTSRLETFFDAEYTLPETLACGESAVAEAAAKHKDYENIHPFHDGNGRTGRMLIQRTLRERGLLTAGVCLPLSWAIYKNVYNYYRCFNVDDYRSIIQHVAVEMQKLPVFVELLCGLEGKDLVSHINDIKKY